LRSVLARRARIIAIRASFRLVARATCLAGELARRIPAAKTASKLAGYTGERHTILTNAVSGPANTDSPKLASRPTRGRYPSGQPIRVAFRHFASRDSRVAFCDFGAGDSGVAGCDRSGFLRSGYQEPGAWAPTVEPSDRSAVTLRKNMPLY
jgi:hypothetical protein